MQVLRFLLLVTLLAPAAAAAQEEVVDPRPGELNPAEIVEQLPTMPPRGTTKAEVRQRLGEPERRVTAVGDPPISRWIYADFTVYFEYDRVLHSVKRDKSGP